MFTKQKKKKYMERKTLNIGYFLDSIRKFKLYFYLSKGDSVKISSLLNSRYTILKIYKHRIYRKRIDLGR